MKFGKMENEEGLPDTINEGKYSYCSKNEGKFGRLL